MKGTEHFKETIKKYLDGRAQADELFAVSYAKENKNLDDCITFILNQVKASGCCGMTDDEVWSLAVHYYDEDNIDVGKPIYARQIGLNTQTGFFFTFMAVGMAISRIFSGKLVDRGKITQVIAAGLYLVVFSFFLLSACVYLIQWNDTVCTH